MRLIVGTLVVFACVFGSYAAMGGHLLVLWQPFEFVIILGAAIGAFIIGNTGPVLKAVPAMLGTLVKGPKYTQNSYVELLGMQYSLFKLAKQKGSMALEPPSKTRASRRFSTPSRPLQQTTTRSSSSATTCGWSRWAPTTSTRSTP